MDNLRAARPGATSGEIWEALRLAAARALLQDAAVLILDEATSALDPATEVRVMENLRGSLGKNWFRECSRDHSVA